MSMQRELIFKNYHISWYIFKTLCLTSPFQENREGIGPHLTSATAVELTATALKRHETFLNHLLDVGADGKKKKDFEDFNTNNPFLKKLPKEAEAANILVGEVDGIDKHIAVFIRLLDATKLGDMTEVPIPSRFIFVLLGPGVRFFLAFSKCLIKIKMFYQN